MATAAIEKSPKWHAAVLGAVLASQMRPLLAADPQRYCSRKMQYPIASAATLHMHHLSCLSVNYQKLLLLPLGFAADQDAMICPVHAMHESAAKSNHTVGSASQFQRLDPAAVRPVSYRICLKHSP